MKCPNNSGGTHAKKPVDSFIVIAQRNATMISKAAPKWSFSTRFWKFNLIQIHV